MQVKTRQVDHSLFFEVGGARYVAWPTKEVIPSGKIEEHNILTVIEIGRDTVFRSDPRTWLEDKLDSYSLQDDVIKPEFFETVLLAGGGHISYMVVETRWGKTSLQSLDNGEGMQCAPGPYIVHRDSLWQVLRLYDDIQKAFLVTLRPDQDERFVLLNDGDHGWDCASAAVKSRLAIQSSRHDLSRYRVAVKDAFDIAGVKTSMCNRAYLGLYPPASSTATAIATLIKRGIQVLGKTKLSSFLSREEPSESVDFQAAWNPRGDGHQGPGGSSSGSAVAVAAYDWVDVGIGTDTNGSIRRPAQCNGVLGLRISQGVFPSTGMFTIFKYVVLSTLGVLTNLRMRFDVPGIFARDLKVLVDFATDWYAADLVAPPTKGLPRKLVYLTDHMPTDDTPQKQAVLSVLRDIEAYFGIEAIGVSLEDLWNENPPEDAKGEKFHDFLNEVGASTFLYENYHSGAHFRHKYREKFQKNPFVSQFVQWRWNIGKKYTQEQFNEGIRRLDIYKQWWLDSILEIKEADTLVVMQSEDVKPNYRDDKPPDYYVQPAWHHWWVSSILGAPEIIVPAGQIPYHSRITGLTEQLPVMVSFMSQPDSDLGLLETTLRFFKHAGRATIVKSGSVMFEIGDDQPLPPDPWT